MTNQIEIISADQREIELLEKNRKINLQKLFTPEGMDLIISEIKEEVSDFSADVSTKEGRAAIKSMAAKVAKCKSPIKNLASELKEESRRLIDGVNAQWNRYEKAMDELRDEIRKPVDEIEEKEAAILKQRQEYLSEITMTKNCTLAAPSMTQEFANELIKQMENLKSLDWGDFKFKAETEIAKTLKVIQDKLEAAKKEAELKEELERLRKEAAERAQKDHEEAIAKAAAEKATKEAEELAARIAQEAEEKAEKERKDAAERERKIEEEKRLAQQAKINAENRAKEAERLAAEQAEQAEIARVAAEKKAKEDAEKAAREAVEKERLRLAEEKRLADLAAEKLAANKKHRAKINQEAHLKIYDILLGGIESEKDQASAIIEAIAKGEVPHVQINY